ncbi:2-amino-4-hydroxy-6-hydroxymethyldihydropteridine diphosphokinase [Geothermobacter ehrlichii]|uniref:2-amino-4-hydroxy-6-hydroxymethyldihydropteridine pyrophosphokinase n=1 Tax=Geothermobacter ehrlichii TaxID=213224 RepID=A0A5D3WPA1_9BACT|nr:2-amino-4-hydroxy-6-hydroxymethyldihydropteridine diphosphokinase [Geothermobacter ehrlichii]TYO99238.1 2-amino-4-hydroxy-6-hydroxymethyldihydropteridine diphosphokinase [Geothermobacter ehrlichii]
MATVYLGLGSNLGARLDNLRRARSALRRLPATTLVTVSGCYETEPVGGPSGQRSYYNAVVCLSTALAPRDLLERTRRIEEACGRVRTERWGPRTLDIDILLYDDLVSDDPELILPHPRLHERGFVLAPLAEMAPDVRPPGLSFTIEQLWRNLPRPGGVVRIGDW